MPLDSLPNEILLKILDYVAFAKEPREYDYESSEKYTASISNVLRCNRQLHSVAEPLLYARLMFAMDGYAAAWHSVNRIGLLFRTIQSKPQVTGWVKELHLHYEDTWYEEINPWTLSDPNEVDLEHPRHGDGFDVRKFIQEELSKHEKSFPPWDEWHCQEWYQDLFEQRNWGDVVALLLTLFSKSLTGLSIDGYNGELPSYVLQRGTSQQSLSPPVPFLSNLRQVQLSLNCGEGGTMGSQGNLRMILPVLRVPSTTHVQIDERVWQYNSLPIGRLNSKLLSLFLHDAFLHYDVEKSFFRSFECLQGIYYGLTSDDKYPPRREERPESHNIFDHLKPCLEDLVFIAPSNSRSCPEPTFATLFEFTKLTRLATTMTALIREPELHHEFNFGEDHVASYSDRQFRSLAPLLPPSLKSLALLDCPGSVFGCLAYLWPLDGSGPKTLLEDVIIGFSELPHPRVNGAITVSRAKEM